MLLEGNMPKFIGSRPFAPFDLLHKSYYIFIIFKIGELVEGISDYVSLAAVCVENLVFVGGLGYLCSKVI